MIPITHPGPATWPPIHKLSDNNKLFTQTLQMFTTDFHFVLILYNNNSSHKPSSNSNNGRLFTVLFVVRINSASPCYSNYCLLLELILHSCIRACQIISPFVYVNYILYSSCINFKSMPCNCCQSLALKDCWVHT